MRPRGTTIPLLVPRLVTLIRQSVDPVQVINGPRAAQDIENDAVLVALTPMGAEAIATTSTDNGLGGRRSENFTVWNLVSCYHGDEDVDGLYARAGAILTDIETGLAVPDALAGVADDLQLGTDMTWTPAQFAQGVALEVSFTITGRCLR